MGGNGQRSEGGLLTAREASRILGISVYTIYAYARQDKIRHVRYGRRVLFLRADLDTFIRRHTRGGDDHAHR